ncbi:tRNA adenosine(34) deaminase TadA [Nitrincola tapanii]|uniref:tRNA-specific adenosine deaminase n=1 Tax=Nitrincola tapanii TaxID=1708751 RepID=A0A5A9W1A2_9GAMM|nr:tRNA adenosine(34) deaminase TadA [Nitrincola tapanii]KAA0873885.1 tRNA adenosine(34) deaminase TadA [Nitrincola tapanii]
MFELNLEEDQRWMREALLLAQQAADQGEVPVGAVVVLNGQIIGRGFNSPISKLDPSAHAEVLALREAALTLGNYRLVEADLYVTLEPCMMCAGALVHARIRRVIYAATEPKSGAHVSQLPAFDLPHLNHHPQVRAGVLAEESSALLSAFFKQRRAQKRAAKQAQAPE